MNSGLSLYFLNLFFWRWYFSNIIQLYYHTILRKKISWKTFCKIKWKINPTWQCLELETFLVIWKFWKNSNLWAILESLLQLSSPPKNILCQAGLNFSLWRLFVRMVVRIVVRLVVKVVLSDRFWWLQSCFHDWHVVKLILIQTMIKWTHMVSDILNNWRKTKPVLHLLAEHL